MLKTLNVDYTVTGVGVEAGGSVVFGAAPAALVAIGLVRQVAIKRDTDYQHAGDFESTDVNRDFDRIVMMLRTAGSRLPTPCASRPVILPMACCRARPIVPSRTWLSMRRATL
ncbi:hypothetical protein LJR084_005400 [Variovorax sp. LjRoot84]|uniref:hypothetical protein n=1 Tax=Variovorax sp. LjRoot84 TaxID=3342340 RepID=UPI003ECC2F86